MPIYSYVCPVCGFRFEDIQIKYTGTRDIECSNGCNWISNVTGHDPGDCVRKKVLLQRDYNDEKAAIIADWQPGYNVGIDYHYKSKADLLSEIKRRGLYPSIHGGGVSVGGSKAGFYGDEEYKHIMKHSEPENIEGLTNEEPVIRT